MWLVRFAVGLLAILTAYELAQFVLGSCQGYSGVAAFERSILGQYFEFWSVDPMRCQQTPDTDHVPRTGQLLPTHLCA